MTRRIKGNVSMANFRETPTALALDPCTIVIFGASGDLAARKLMPSLYHLYVTESLPKPFAIVGCARTSMSHEQFRKRMEAACRKAGMEPSGWNAFASRLFYHPLEYDSPASFASLKAFLNEQEGRHRIGGNKLFYLAVPPTLVPGISDMIGQAGLAEEGGGGSPWTRIVVEKPFGRDLRTALELDGILHRNFRERQIFRIDHYLAKETVQNILMLRFANTIFEPVWNRSYIDYVGIITAEKLGVEHRAGYYEQAGVLRDMFQNHMMQLLSLTAMEPPSLFEADRVRDEKTKVFRALKSLVKLSQDENLILGQYGPGIVDGRHVPAYREEPGVYPGSLIPTFAMLRVFIDNWRWRDVPFYLVSGKRLARKETRIVIQFKRVPHSMFENILGEKIIANRLVLGIYPNEEIVLTFQAKMPGRHLDLRSVTMDFRYYEGDVRELSDAYEKVLLDCIQGDQMLFWRQDGVELCWSFLTPILEECETCAGRAEKLHFYEAGSWGPERGRDWMHLIVDF